MPIRKRPKQLYHPRYWGVWALLALLRVAILLPFGAQLALGRAFGAVLARTSPRRRRIAAANLARCFPELDPAARARLLAEHFAALGIALVEIAQCWWGDARRLERLVRFRGLEHLEAARAAGRGALLLSAHFTTLEIGGRLLGLRARFHPMYKPSRNPVIERYMRGRRVHHFQHAIPMDDVRGLLRSLKDNVPVWYAPDQGFRGKGALEVPFFGQPAPTNPATARIARTSGAPVLPFFVRRLPGAEGYELEIGAPLEGYPTDDPAGDALRINHLIEEAIRRCPEQYLWAHDRFKEHRED
jgi:KDO2-lipid IV(A) lauroyltransferase